MTYLGLLCRDEWTLLVSDLRVDHRFTLGSFIGVVAHHAAAHPARDRHRVRRGLPQHPAAGADVPLVLRDAGGAARGVGD
jgi:hypothetical protein